MKKLRVSYSLLSTWAKGRVDDAVALYFHMDRPTSKAMEEGKRIHNEIAEFTRNTGKLPPYLPNITLDKPLPENKIVVSYNEQFDLVAVIDCLDSPNLIEYKTGFRNSLHWSNTKQVPFYFFVCELAGLGIERGDLIHYNQFTKNSDFVRIWNNDSLQEEARNYIDSLAPEIYDFFIKEGLL